MHSLTTTLLRHINDASEAGSLPHPRDLKAAGISYYRYFTAFLTGSEAEYDKLSKPADRLLDQWEIICEDYYATFPESTSEEKIQMECHTAFTELLNYLNEAPETPVKFRKHLAAQDLDVIAEESFLPELPEGTESEVTAKNELAEDNSEDQAETPAAPDKVEVVLPAVAAIEADPEVEKVVIHDSLPPPPPLKVTPTVAKKITKKISAKKKSKPVKPPLPKPATPSDLVYQLRIGLEGADDAIWRRVFVPAATELADLHRLLQLLFDWNGDHMHRFKVNYDYFGPANPDGMDQRELYDGITLESIYTTGTNKLRYTYDFADKWEHLILIEKTLAPEPGKTYPQVTNGAGKAPLDGSGGTDKYSALAEALGDPQHPKHDLARDILGRDWEVDYFAPGEINELLRKRF